MASVPSPGPAGFPSSAANDAWQQILRLVRERVDSQNFATWLQPARASLIRDTTLYVRVPNHTFKDWIEAHYRNLIEEAVRALGLPVHRVEFAPETSQEEQWPAPPRRPVASADESWFSSPLNPRYSFSAFVVGASNQFAHAAASRVARDPGCSYNPLFLYGGVGLGKTHLMQAIGHELRQRFPHWRVVYVSAERFTNEMVQSIKNDRMVTFHERFRHIDTLLVDDVQFLSGKEGTQEEFFHTFNTLYERQKQIAISSDRPPNEIPRVEERLRSRFGCGLIADIQLPDLETRLAILMKKAEAEAFPLPEKVALFVAMHVKSNIRELEGSLIRLMAYSSLTGEEMTESMAHQVLKDLVETQGRQVTIELIQRSVCEHYNLRLNELKAKDNSQRVVVPRQVAMWMARRLTQASLPEIARAFGDKHHTTVLHSIAKISKQRLVDKDLNRTLNRLLASFQ